MMIGTLRCVRCKANVPYGECCFCVAEETDLQEAEKAKRKLKAKQLRMARKRVREICIKDGKR